MWEIFFMNMSKFFQNKYKKTPLVEVFFYVLETIFYAQYHNDIVRWIRQIVRLDDMEWKVEYDALMMNPTQWLAWERINRGDKYTKICPNHKSHIQ